MNHNNLSKIRAMFWNIKLADLSAHCNVSIEAIRLIETGQSNPRVTVALSLADYFLLSVEDLFERTWEELQPKLDQSWVDKIWHRSREFVRIRSHEESFLREIKETSGNSSET